MKGVGGVRGRGGCAAQKHVRPHLEKQAIGSKLYSGEILSALEEGRGAWGWGEKRSEDEGVGCEGWLVQKCDKLHQEWQAITGKLHDREVLYV